MRITPIRVLVVDDSALMRKLIPQMLAGDDSIEVVGTAMDGAGAEVPRRKSGVLSDGSTCGLGATGNSGGCSTAGVCRTVS